MTDIHHPLHHHNTHADPLISHTSLLRGGSTLAWRNIQISVPLKVPKSKHAQDIEAAPQTIKTILKNVSGYVQPGQILFVMGPSGSGKSTLLDSLADRIKLPVSGSQILDGSIKSPSALKSIAKYVQQTDDLLGVLTVRETFDFAANLYISHSDSRQSAVEEVMNILGLTEHANTKIGNSFIRGLSGGQLRRVSIGFELVAAPNLLFLDEPTSGLDSATAFHVMGELRRIAKETGMSMIITVHQPSELVFEMADNFLLVSNGNMCYFGPAEQAANYFRRLGFEQPPRTSDIDWMLDLVNMDFGDVTGVEKVYRSWPSSEESKHLENTLETLGVPSHDTIPPAESGSLQYPVGFFQQTKVLTRRGILNTIRNPAVLWLRFAMYLLLSLMIGLVWLRLGTSASVIIETNNAIFFFTAFMIFMSISVLPAYLEERSVLVRERANGGYSVPAYILAHTLYEIPYVLVLALLSSAVAYYMVGLTNGADRFFVFVANLFTSLFVAESIMVLLAAVIPVLIIAIAAGAMIFGLYMCMTGGFISLDEIGWWIRWVKFISLHFYSFSTFMENQYRDTTFTASPDTFPPYPTDVDGDTIPSEFGLEERIWVNFLAQIAMIVVYRLLAAAWLHVFIHGKK